MRYHSNNVRTCEPRPQVIWFWVAALAGSGYFAPRLMKDTVFAFNPPVGSPASVANQKVGEPGCRAEKKNTEQSREE